MAQRTRYFNGNKGKAWVAGSKIPTTFKGHADKVQNYEEIPAENGDGVIRVPTSSKLELSISYKKTGAEWEIDMFDLEKDITVILAEENIDGSIRRRCKFDGVTWDKQSLINFEKQKVGEVELTGQAETHEILE